MAHATKPAVLITDDDPGIRGLLATVTLQTGCTVDTAANGYEAMEKMRKGSYDLLLLDLMMPMMSGYDVVAQMKEMEQRPAVIVVTAIHDDDATTILDGSVVSSILRKPFDVNAASDFIRVTASAVRDDRAA
ncbi:MAG: two-component system response regulator [Thermoanaerobaculia bacterium]